MSEDRPKYEVDGVKGDVVELIRDHDKGNVACEMTRDLAGVIEAVLERGGKGKLTITVSVELAAKFGARAIVVTMDYETKKPKPERKAEFRFATDDGRLVHDDPDQLEFELREEKKDRSEGVTVSAVASLPAETRATLAKNIK
ncbi:MAG TPA: hypothetical protein VI911_00305 [Patescibacteria group bacterium]|nr:hypothetical protein [Patescibacteria group bacterium]